MAEEGANLVGRFGREDVLELAGLLLDFSFAVHGETVRKQAFGETVSADDAACFVAASCGQFHD
jgi:hypothetical protein